MSHHDYEICQRLSRGETSFPALIMAAMHRADPTSLEKLHRAFPKIRHELRARDATADGRLDGERLDVRLYSRDPQHNEDDMRAGLAFAHSEGTIGDRVEPILLLEHPDSAAQFHRDGPQDALRHLARTDPLAFGLICRFHLEGKTSLMADAEVVSREALTDMGLTPRDIGWPPSVLSGRYERVAEEDPERDARLAAAIAAWRIEHQND